MKKTITTGKKDFDSWCSNNGIMNANKIKLKKVIKRMFNEILDVDKPNKPIKTSLRKIKDIAG